VFAGVLPDYQYYKKTEEWHEQYGSDVVRTGPREVNIYCADAIPVIHGPMSRCRKTLWYVGGNTIGGKSVLSERDKNEHKVRRKAWDHALSTKALREYEPRLNRHARALMSQLETQAKQPSVRITNWINFYSFDVMGDVGFNRSFGMVEKGEEDATIKLLHESMAPISIFTHLAWAIDLITKTASGVKPLHDHINWTRKVLQQRLKVKIQQTELLRRADETQTTPKEKDIISWLIDPNKVEISPDLNADARLLVVAGR
jgi:cytochrome P450